MSKCFCLVLHQGTGLSGLVYLILCCPHLHVTLYPCSPDEIIFIFIIVLFVNVIDILLMFYVIV